MLARKRSILVTGARVNLPARPIWDRRETGKTAGGGAFGYLSAAAARQIIFSIQRSYWNGF
jgi:hypothetical protein